MENNSEDDIAMRCKTVGAELMYQINRHAENFEEFVLLPDRYDISVFDKLSDNQLDYISDDGSIIVDHILRFENLSQEFDHFARTINFEGKLSHSNKSRPRNHYRQYYNDITRHSIERRFRRDLEYFQYDY